ncbi:proton-coupled folate transporter-like [Diadema antillarum]|uniref:proton-coupled folate transporter-like n=1 Tax=Diadema antillarum TaxID=105358 RepID=UPI003A8986FB
MMERLRRVITVEPVLFFFMLGSFLQYLALQQLLYEKVCLFEINDTYVCQHLPAFKDEEIIVQKSTSYWLIILNVALAVPAIFSTIMLGSWSDRVGRRAPMILPCIGSVVNGVCLLFSALYMDLTIGIMILGSVLMGLLGAYPTLTSAVFSYLGDITQERSRTKRFGFLEAMTFGGSFIGVLTCGIVIDHLGFVAVFIYYIVCNILATLYIVLWLKESSELVKDDATRGSSMKDEVLHSGGTMDGVPQVQEDGTRSCGDSCMQLCRLRNLAEAFKTVARERPNTQRMQLILLISCLFIFQVIGTGENDTTVLYLKKEPLNFTSSQISYYSGTKSGLQTLTLFTLMPCLHWLSVPDCFIAVGALCFRMSGYVVFGLARTLWQVFIVTFLLAPSGLPAATTRAMMSKIVSPAEQGSLFALTAALETVTGVVATIVFNALYPATLHIVGGGFVFILMGTILLIPACLLMVIWYVQKQGVPYQTYQEGNGSPTDLYGDT